MLDDLIRKNIEFKLNQAKYFLKQMQSNQARPELEYNTSAFSNTIYSVCQYLKELNESFYKKELRSSNILSPFLEYGETGGIRGMDVHKQPLKVSKKLVTLYLPIPRAVEEGSTPFIRVKDEQIDLFPLCESVIEYLEKLKIDS